MAQLTPLDLECLEYQTGFLSGLVLGSWGEPEKMFVYATRCANVLALLGRVREHEYYTQIAATAASYIGRVALKAWDQRPLRHRLATTRSERNRWLQAYTDSLLAEAESQVRRISDEADEFRTAIADQYAAKASSGAGSRLETPVPETSPSDPGAA